MSRIYRLVASGVIGVLLAYALLWCWAYLAANNPLPGLLARSGVGSDGTGLILTASDFLMNIIMCLPAAWALNSLGQDLRLNTLVSVVAFAVTSSFLVGLPLHDMSLRIGIRLSQILACRGIETCSPVGLESPEEAWACGLTIRSSRDRFAVSRVSYSPAAVRLNSGVS